MNNWGLGQSYSVFGFLGIFVEASRAGDRSYSGVLGFGNLSYGRTGFPWVLGGKVLSVCVGAGSPARLETLIKYLHISIVRQISQAKN